jgi:hypothetical protein
MLELDRVRRIEVALIARVLAFGRLEPAKIFASQRDEVAWVVQHFLGAKLWKSRPKFAIDRLPEMPTDEPQRSAEAVRRALPSLLKLRRYEVRAIAERDRAVSRARSRQQLKLGPCPCLQNEPNFYLRNQWDWEFYRARPH